MPILHTERLRFLPMTVAHAEVALHGGGAALHAYTGLHVPIGMLTPSDFARILPVRLAKLQHDPSLADWYGWVVHNPTDTILGIMGFKSKPDDHGTVEISYRLHEAWQGQGFATEMVHALVTWAFTQPDVCRITATDVERVNTASISLLRQIGMTLVAETHAGLSFELLRRRWETG